MFSLKNRIAITVIALIAFASLISGFFVSQHLYKKKHIDVSQFHGTLLDKPRDIHSFSLNGIDNKTFDNASLHGEWTMVFFGFTSCGYLCPTTMAELGKMYRLLEEKGVRKLPKVMMISVDPDRDSLIKLKSYVKAFDRHFYAARGDEGSIAAMTREMGIVYAKVALKDSEEANNYDIEHTGTVMLFDPQGKLDAFFTTPHQAELLAEDYMLLVS